MHKLSAPRKGRFSLGLLFVVFGALAFMAGWLVPNHYPPWVGFHNEAAMFVALILFCAGFATDPKSVRLPVATLAIFAALIAIICLQWYGRLIIYAGDALVSSVFVMGFALAWWLGARTVFVPDASERGLLLGTTLMVAAACVSTLVAVLQWLNLEGDMLFFVAERGPNRPYANLAQPNLLATLLVTGTVLAYWLYLRQRIKTWQLLTVTVWMSFGLITTESRAGLLSAFCVGVFFMLRAMPTWHAGGWRIVAMWWGLLAVLGGVWRPLNALLALQATRQTELAVDNVRLVIWKQVIAGITQAPWFGYGWRQTVIAQKIGVEKVAGDFPSDYAHSVVLDVLAWVGLPLGTLLLLVGAWWLLRTIGNLKDSTELLLFSATIPFLVHSLVEFPFAYAFFLFPMAWIFGALQARQAPVKFRIGNSVPRFSRLASIAGLLGFTLLCGQLALEYFEAEEDFRVMRFEMRKLGSKSAEYEAPRLILLTQLDDLLAMGRMIPARGMSPADIEHLRKANLSRHWGSLNMKYVIALGLNGQTEQATKELRNIKALYGAEMHRSAVDEIRTLRIEKYPELALLRIE